MGLLVTRGRGYMLQIGPGQTDVDRFEGMAARGRGALAEGDGLTAAAGLRGALGGGRGGEARAEGDGLTAGAVLREALGVWGGPPLADFAYEPFAQAEIARLD